MWQKLTIVDLKFNEFESQAQGAKAEQEYLGSIPDLFLYLFISWQGKTKSQLILNCSVSGLSDTYKMNLSFAAWGDNWPKFQQSGTFNEFESC